MTTTTKPMPSNLGAELALAQSPKATDEDLLRLAQSAKNPKARDIALSRLQARTKTLQAEGN